MCCSPTGMDLSHLIGNFEQTGFRSVALRSAQEPTGVSEHLLEVGKDRLDGMASQVISFSVLQFREPLAQAVQQQLVATNLQHTTFCVTHSQADRRQGAARAVSAGTEEAHQ